MNAKCIKFLKNHHLIISLFVFSILLACLAILAANSNAFAEKIEDPNPGDGGSVDVYQPEDNPSLQEDKQIEEDVDKLVDSMLYPDTYNNSGLETMMGYLDENYNDPYNSGDGNPFMMLEQNELASLVKSRGDDGTSGADNRSALYGKYKNGSSGKLDDGFSEKDTSFLNNLPDEVRRMDAAHIVAFSTLYNGNPRKDHIAVVGYVDDNGQHNIYMCVYNATSGHWSDKQHVILGYLPWIDDGGKSYYGDIEPYIDITAGDYDGDNVDTLLVYFANHIEHGVDISEFVVTDDDDGTPRIGDCKGTDTGFNFLHKAYASGGREGMANIYGKAGHRAAGKGSLHARLKTGDFNGDGVDDLAVLSSLEFEKSSQAEDCDWHLGIPYLAVGAGARGDGLWNKNMLFSDYVGIGNIDESAKKADTVNIENLCVARLSKHAADSIIVGGRRYHFEGNSSGNLASTDHSDKLGMARYDFKGSDKGMEQIAFATTCYDTSGNSQTMNIGDATLYGNYSGSYAWTPICAQTVYMNGKGNDPYFLMDGNIYQWKADCKYPQRVYDTGLLDDADKTDEPFVPNDQNFCALASTCAGNFDGNSEGYEQVVFSFVRRVTGSDDCYVSFAIIGMNNSSHNTETGLPNSLVPVDKQPYDLGFSDSLFNITKNSAFDKRFGSTRDHGVCLAMCCMDYNYDGMCVKLHNKGLVYSDPVLECAIQASPFYEGNWGGATTKIGVSMGEVQGVTLTEEEKTSQGFSIGFNRGKERLLSADAGLGTTKNVNTNFKAGTTDGYKLGFSVNVGKTAKREWEATDRDSIIVTRYPFLYFNYDLQDNDNPDNWSSDEVNITCLKDEHSIMRAFSTDQYNLFVEKYNEAMETNSTEKFNKLIPITDLDLTSNVGQPFNYKDMNLDSNYWATDKPFAVGTGDGDTAELNLGKENSWEKQRGLNFQFDKNVTRNIKLPTGPVTRSLGFSHGSYKDYQEMWAYSNNYSKSRSFLLSWQVRNTDFESRAGIWEATDVVMRYDDTGENPLYYLPVYGYLTREIKKLGTTNGGTQNPPSPPNDPDIHKTENTDTAKGTDVQSNLDVVDKAYAADNNDALKITWNAPEGGQNYSYQVYTCVNGQVVKVGNPVKATEFDFDIYNPPEAVQNLYKDLKVSEWPVYQFAVSSIDENGLEGQRTAWMYYFNTSYFNDEFVCSISRNNSDSDKRLSIGMRQGNEKFIYKLADAFRLNKNDHPNSGLSISIFENGKFSDHLIASKDGENYKINNAEVTGEVDADVLYTINMESTSNSSDTKKFVVRLNDGKFAFERKLEAEILSYWASPEEVVSALENPETRSEAAAKVVDINQSFNGHQNVKLTGEAKDVYKAAVATYNKVYFPQKFNVWLVIVPAVLVLLAAGLIVFFVVRKKKLSNAGASAAPKKLKDEPVKYGTY